MELFDNDAASDETLTNDQMPDQPDQLVEPSEQTQSKIGKDNIVDSHLKGSQWCSGKDYQRIHYAC